MAGLYCLSRLGGVSQFGRHRVRCRGGQLFGQLGNPLFRRLRGLQVCFGGGLQLIVGDGRALLSQPVSNPSQLGTLGSQFVVRKGCSRRYFGELGRRRGRDTAVRLQVGAGFDASRVGLLEFGTRGGGVHRDVVGLLSGTQLNQFGAQVLDLVVTAQADQGCGQLIAAALQLAPALIGKPRRCHVRDLRGR